MKLKPNFFCRICRQPVLFRKTVPRSGYCSFCITIDPEVKASLEKSLKDNADVWRALAQIENDEN